MAPNRRPSTSAPAATGKAKQPKTTTVAAAGVSRNQKPSRRSSTTGGTAVSTSGSSSARKQPNAKEKGKRNAASATGKDKGGVASGRVEKRKSTDASTSTSKRRRSSVATTNGAKVSSKASTKSKGKSKVPQSEDENTHPMDLDTDPMDLDTDSPSSDNSPSHPILLPQKLRIPLQTVDTKWTHLPPPSQTLVTNFLTTIESTVLNTFTSTTRRAEAHSALRNIKRKLISQLPKIPVPAVPVKDLGLDLQKLQEMNRGIESRMRPTLMQISTLDREISDVRKRIEGKKRQLAELRANARREEIVRKERVKSVHGSLRKPLSEVEEKFRGESVVVEGEEGKVGWGVGASASAGPGLGIGGEETSAYDPSNDPEVVELKRKLESHLASVAANLKPLEGFAERICGVRGVVEEVLGRMGREVVEGVMEV